MNWVNKLFGLKKKSLNGFISSVGGTGITSSFQGPEGNVKAFETIPQLNSIIGVLTDAIIAGEIIVNRKKGEKIDVQFIKTPNQYQDSFKEFLKMFFDNFFTHGTHNPWDHG